MAKKVANENAENRKQQSANKKRGGGLNTSYLTKMGVHNLVANRSMSFSSISVLSACLLLIGISMMIIMNIQNLVQDVEKQNVILAFVADGADDVAVAQVDAHHPHMIAKLCYEIGNRHATLFWGNDDHTFITPYTEPMLVMIQKLHGVTATVKTLSLDFNKAISASINAHTHG